MTEEDMESFTQHDYSEILIHREAGTVVKRVTGWLEFGIFEREVAWLKRLQDLPFVPRLLNVDPAMKCIVTSYCGEPVTLENLPDDWELQARFILNRLERAGCRHNDIKPSEILVHNGELRLIDFGWATEVGAPRPADWPPALGLNYRVAKNHYSDAFAFMLSICHLLEGKLDSEQAPVVERPAFDFCATPNMYNEQPRLVTDGDWTVVHGYQRYRISAQRLEAEGGNFTNPKSQSLMPFITGGSFAGKTVNDLGCANGFFTFAALFAGATTVNAVDLDESHLQLVQGIVERYGFNQVRPLLANVHEYEEAADITICLALIHWIFSCTSFFGRFDDCIGHLSKLTTDTLIIEWIDPSDKAIQGFKHTSYNQPHQTEAYTQENFLAALTDHFPHTLAELPVSESRKVYIVSKSAPVNSF
jgi:2-polyprenyl-3-methyl-5-hydroxy-6-metoxy-1,4-benzoquinol methylase